MNAPPRWSSIGSHSAAALGPTAATTPPAASTASSASSTGVSLSVLRRCIDESPTSQTARAPAHDASRALVLGLVALQHHQRLDDDAHPLAPQRGITDQRRRLLEGVGRGEHDDPVGAGGSQQAAVEVVVGHERAAAGEGDHTGHGGRLYAPACRRHRFPVCRLGCYSRVTRLHPMGEINTVGIVGSGIMGAGLAEVAARSGFQVIVRSRTKAGAEAVVAGVARQPRPPGRQGPARGRRARRHRRPDHRHPISSAHLADCDLVIESVVEDLPTKRELFSELEQIVKPEGILATNTSTLPVIEMAVATQRPDRVCGIHFFNPAPMMKLVEVVRPLTASDDTIKTAMAFATACGKDAIEVGDRAGFVVNALLFPYLNNAVRMLENGTASRDDIDTAMKGGCNFPMGPLALLDLVGLDTSVSILDALYAEFGDPNYAAVPTLRRMVAAGHLGRKAKRGFYEY